MNYNLLKKKKKQPQQNKQKALAYNTTVTTVFALRMI